MVERTGKEVAALAMVGVREEICGAEVVAVPQVVEEGATGRDGEARRAGRKGESLSEGEGAAMDMVAVEVAVVVETVLEMGASSGSRRSGGRLWLVPLFRYTALV